MTEDCLTAGEGGVLVGEVLELESNTESNLASVEELLAVWTTVVCFHNTSEGLVSKWISSSTLSVASANTSISSEARRVSWLGNLLSTVDSLSGVEEVGDRSRQVGVLESEPGGTVRRFLLCQKDAWPLLQMLLY